MQLRRIDLKQLTPQQLVSYTPLLLSSAIVSFQRHAQYPLVIAVEATRDSYPIGLAFVACEPDIRTGKLLSLFVKEEERGKGIGTALTQKIEEELIQSGCNAISTEFADDNPTRAPFEKILHKRKWTSPTIYMVCCHYEIQKLHPPWFRRSEKLPNDFEEFPWVTLKSEERARLEFQAQQYTFPATISPFIEEETIEPINSLGLRYQGEVIGWMITHRTAPDTITYSSLYTHREYRFKRYAIQLLIDSIRLQQQSPVPYALFRTNLEQADRSWVYFIKRRLIPYAQHVQRIYWCWHQLREYS